MNVGTYMKRFGAILALMCMFSAAQAQYAELGFTLGGNYYIGDLNPYKHYPENTSIAGGVIFRYNFDKRYTMKMNLLFGSLKASDANSNSEVQLQRNLQFRSSLMEFGVGIEVNFFEYEIGDKKHWITPYMFLGLAYYKFNPEAKIDDTWFELQPLGTEGQGTTARPNSETYSLNQINIPFGLGLKVSVSDRIGIGFEWGYRLTFTDFLDDVSGTYVDNDLLAFENGPLAAELADRSISPNDVLLENADSQRGNPESNDWYVYSGVMLTFKLGNKFKDCKNQLTR